MLCVSLRVCGQTVVCLIVCKNILYNEADYFYVNVYYKRIFVNHDVYYVVLSLSRVLQIVKLNIFTSTF